MESRREEEKNQQAPNPNQQLQEAFQGGDVAPYTQPTQSAGGKMASGGGPGDSNNAIVYTSFNQDYGCFACGTENGFKIFNSFPFKDSHKRSK